MNLRQIQYHTGRFLPEKLKNRISRFQKKRAAKQRNAAKQSAIARFGMFDVSELAKVLREAGVIEGCVLFVHCSFNDMFTFSGTSIDVLKVLRALVGSSGTLLMPAYTAKTCPVPPRLFDVTREPTRTGVVNEIFRRSPGVIRSLHPRHSICGEGPLAKELLSGHETCIRADGPDSPFDRLRRRNDAFILTLGLPPGFVSILHWLEDIDPSKLPFPVHADEPVLCRVRDIDGRIVVVKDWHVLKNVSVRVDFAGFSKNLSPSAMQYWEHKGLALGLYPVKTLTEELLALRDQGIIHYR